MKYLVGIDLGTSNCALAFAEPGLGELEAVTDFGITQVLRPGESGPRPLLPSCLYIPGTHELPAGSTQLPWGFPEPSPGGQGSSDIIAGEFARWQGARVPDRFVSSAKSWLCHPGVDRTAPILPWGAPAEVKKLSPVEASALLLSHMAQAWNYAHPGAMLAEQEVIITVPASFDEVARALTVSAARQAGLEKFALVEEPQAAFYDFASQHRRDLGRLLSGVRLVLVIDVGGGTSDFTLIQVTASAEEGPSLRRIAVGEHLMLGGDNMDAALARKAEEKLVSAGRKLSAAQWTQLVQAARLAKEALLSDSPPAEFTLSVSAEGSRLVGGSLSARLTAAEASGLVLDGFLPRCSPEEAQVLGPRVGLHELGLPYASDPGITRHLAAFLRTHAAAGFAALEADGRPGMTANKRRLPRPDAILLNGGVFNSSGIAGRLVHVISSWWTGWPEIPLLPHTSLDLAVARGAAYYGLVRRGIGKKISGGAAHALYVGLQKSGEESPMALCVIPRGQEEGETVDLGGRVFQLALGQPVKFPLFSTTADRLDREGDIVPVMEDMRRLPPIHALLKGSGGKSGKIPIHLQSTVTEIGTLELWCVAQNGKERWRLEFELRGHEGEPEVAVAESMPAAFQEARLWVERIYGGKPKPLHNVKGTPPKDVKQLWASLERTLGPRDQWRLPILRELWSVLIAGAAKRRRSADHERVFFQLLGFSLRPGLGYPLDDWRCEQSMRLFGEPIEFHKEKPVWNEFWILWRRLSGGLSEARQQEIWSAVEPHLGAKVPLGQAKVRSAAKGIQPQGVEEMARLAASLEHLEPALKLRLGGWIATRFAAPETAGGPWTWALGRLGARVPIYGSVHKTVPPPDASRWIGLLLEPRILALEGTLFALTQLARLTGDRVRDIDSAIRERVTAALAGAGAPESWSKMVTEMTALGDADRARALGDTLPIGLSI